MSAEALPVSDLGGQVRPNRWLVTVSVLFGAMMGAIDTSVVNVALAHIQATYGVTTQQVTWVSTSYLITPRDGDDVPNAAWWAAALATNGFSTFTKPAFPWRAFLAKPGERADGGQRRHRPGGLNRWSGTDSNPP